MYGADPKRALTTQVGHCAGLFHMKVEPHLVHIVSEGTSQVMSLDAFAAAFGIDPAEAQERHAERLRPAVEAEPPPWGWDHPGDIKRAKAWLGVESNWSDTSDGGVSVFKAACYLRDLGISPELAEELISDAVPVWPGGWPQDHIARKVAHAIATQRMCRAAAARKGSGNTRNRSSWNG